jgi:hypothetical protein
MHPTARLPVALAFVVVACSSKDEPAPATNTGLACTAANQCYAGLEAGAIKGTPICLSLQGGYCSHTCTVDSDCCAVEGECAKGIKEICSPLESNPAKYCFISCETADMPAGSDPNAFCGANATRGFTCRSTGGGTLNRKFCGG